MTKTDADKTADTMIQTANEIKDMMKALTKASLEVKKITMTASAEKQSAQGLPGQ